MDDKEIIDYENGDYYSEYRIFEKQLMTDTKKLIVLFAIDIMRSLVTKLGEIFPEIQK